MVIKRKQSAPGLFQGTPSSSTRVAVSNLQAETKFDGTLVTLTWSAPAVSFNPATSLYQIYKSNSFIATVPGTVTTYEDTAVTPGVEYVYSVFLIYTPL